MADRIFGLIVLAITIGYSIIAFTVIEAPFQYDPLGPETWPQILGVGCGLTCLWIIIRPDSEGFKVAGTTLGRIGIVLALLIGYAWMFEPLGFIISSALFCALLARMLGGTNLRSILFGAVSGIVGYILCAGLLELNLPAGIIVNTLRSLQ